MERKTDVSEDKKSLIIRNTAKGIPVEAIAEELGRHQRTIKRFLADPSPRKRSQMWGPLSLNLIETCAEFVVQ